MKAIMYHYVRPDAKEYPNLRYLHIDDFKLQLGYLKENYDILDGNEFAKALQGHIALKNKAVLTFDDAFKEHYSYVFPVLKKANLKGIFYVPTLPYIERKLLVVHRIQLLIGKYGGKKIYETVKSLVTDDMLLHSHVEEFHTMPYRIRNDNNYTKEVKKILNYYLNHELLTSVLDELMNIFFPNEKELVDEFYMTEKEIRQLHDYGMVIGSHTVNHFVMSKLTIEQQKKEIENSFDFLESVITSFLLKTFSYPFGGFHTFTNDTIQLLNNISCDFSFNVEAREISQKDLSIGIQKLPRYDCNVFPYGKCRN
jgi:peptidoglycan/xylan/chitin deacetylase (PgdA/CDA1 family)